MKRHEIVVQDKQQHLHTLVRVKDCSFNPETLMDDYIRLWICSVSHEFVPFELWSKLDHAKINEVIEYQDYYFKVVDIHFLEHTTNYS